MEKEYGKYRACESKASNETKLNICFLYIASKIMKLGERNEERNRTTKD